MEFGFYPTPPPLNAVVKAVWFPLGIKAEFEVPEPVVPDGCVEIIFNLADKFRRYHANGEVETQAASPFAHCPEPWPEGFCAVA